jgi:hypothetical protein
MACPPSGSFPPPGYLRQSMLAQVRPHPQSTQRQDALRENALERSGDKPVVPTGPNWLREHEPFNP